MGDLVPQSSTALATTFGKSHKLSVRQRKRWLEILTSLDARNVYVVYDEMGSPVLNVEEQGSGFGAFMKRLFLQWSRPFTSHVEDLSTGGAHLLTLRRPFRFIFHRLEVAEANGTKLGAIQRKWTWFRRKYIVEGPEGQEVATLFGPFFSNKRRPPHNQFHPQAPLFAVQASPSSSYKHKLHALILCQCDQLRQA